jgi:pimeloyl-ACP methyl ester carboxylesterase
MAKANSMEFLAAATSRAALECYLAAVTDVDLSAFAPADIQAMNGPYWDWQLSAIDSSSDEGAIEDVLASVRDWDVDPASVETPVLVIHGREDSFVPVAHAEWIADTCKNTELVLKDGGHISTIPDGAIALPWFASIFSTGG